MLFAKIRACAASALLSAIVAFALAPAFASADGRAPGCEEQSTHSRTYIVAFDTGSAAIRSEDREKLAAAAKRSKDRYIQKICLLAYADPRGSVEANRALSLRRAAAVEADLRQRGVTAAMESHALGEAPGGFLEFLTDDAQEDRRVRIVLVK
ncbi:MAG: OmpA family protein [Pseudomonadota bacterium]